jgi:hypothetical protein
MFVTSGGYKSVTPPLGNAVFNAGLNVLDPTPGNLLASNSRNLLGTSVGIAAAGLSLIPPSPQQSGKKASSVPQGDWWKYAAVSPGIGIMHDAIWSGDAVSVLRSAALGPVQGALNIANAATDMAIDLANAAVQPPPVTALQQVGIPVPKSIPSPAWSRGLVTHEDPLLHEISKTSGGVGLGILLGGPRGTNTPLATASKNITAESVVRWVDEGGNLRSGSNPGMRPNAYNYQSATPGARSNVLTGRSQAPYLEFTDSGGNIIGAKFDGVRGAELIDRKMAPVFSAKAVNEAVRQAAVAKHHSLQAVWELPNQDAVNAANRFMRTNNITDIRVRLGK